MKALLPLLFSLSTAIAQPIVEVKGLQASYKGIADQGIERYLGIHYAQDTSGENRFKAPVPFAPKKGSTVDATTPGLPCSQPRNDVPPYIVGRGETGEDCLTLSIHRPANTTADANLPVVVWVYGGAYMLGAGDDPIYDPTNFLLHSVRTSRPVIYAALNYRLGIFGFAASPSMRGEHSTNAALRDQRLALEWIRDHISSFGGDPQRILVYGQSAGGTSMSLQTLAWAGRDLPFQRVLTMSGPPGNCYNMSRDTTQYNTAQVASRFKCLTDQNHADLDCLRRVPHDDLLREQIDYAHTLHPPFGTFVYLPIVDDDLFTGPPSQLIRSGKVASDVSFIRGWVHDEAGAIVGPNPNIVSDESLAEVILELFPTLRREHTDELVKLYPVEDFVQKAQDQSNGSVSPHWFRSAAIMNDFIVRCPDLDFAWNFDKATRQSPKNSRDSTRAGVRLYNFNQTAYRPLLDQMGVPFLGVIHGSEIPYSRGNIPDGNEHDADSHRQLSERFMNAIINFAATGDPSSDDAFGEWPEAFGDQLAEQGPDSYSPPRMKVQVVGGSQGSGVADIASGVFTSPSDDTKGMVGGDGGVLQSVQAWADDAGVSGMPWDWDFQRVVGAVRDLPGVLMSGEETKRDRARKIDMEAQKLFERCRYVNSLASLNGV